MGFGGGGGTNKARSDINVTPLVDVVLVLLIIFLVTMPVLMKELNVEVPRKSDDVAAIEHSANQLIVELKTGDRLFLEGQEINRVDLANRLRDRLEKRREKDRIVFIDVEPLARYGSAVSIIDTIKGAGALTVAIKMRDEDEDKESP
jgi:biopolymer transport protein TolR